MELNPYPRLDTNLVKYSSFKKNSHKILILCLILSIVTYCIMALMKKHSDFWLISSMSSYFTVFGFNFSEKTTIYYPSLIFIIQGLWIKFGSLFFNIPLPIQLSLHGVPKSLQFFLFLPILFSLICISLTALIFLKNKWNSLITLGTISFASVAVMGQVEVCSVLFIFLSQISLIKACKSRHYFYYSFLSIVFLAISTGFVPFGAFLYPLNFIFISYLFFKNHVSIFKILSYLTFFVVVAILFGFGYWFFNIASLTHMQSNHEAGMLLGLTIGPHPISLWLFTNGLILFFAFTKLFSKQNINSSQLPRYYIFYNFTVFASFFIFVYSLPQWWILLLPAILLALDEFPSKLNYLFNLVFMTTFILFPMAYIQNVDVIMQHYIPTFFIKDQGFIVLYTIISASIILFIINMHREINEEIKSIDYRKFNFYQITPLLTLILPYFLCYALGFSIMLFKGFTLSNLVMMIGKEFPILHLI